MASAGISFQVISIPLYTMVYRNFLSIIFGPPIFWCPEFSNVRLRASSLLNFADRSGRAGHLSDIIGPFAQHHLGGPVGQSSPGSDLRSDLCRHSVVPLGLGRIVALQYISTTLYQVSYHIQ